ncbi:MAG: hypothetical protein ABIP41_02245 [Croceibacterium sp.]
MTEAAVLTPHIQAAAEIAAWRGRCIDVFAKGERAVGQVLELANAKDGSIKIRHLAGQRMADVEEIVDKMTATASQQQAARDAIGNWKDAENKRAFIAHGISTPLLDRNGYWYVHLDFVAYRGSRCEARRWSVSGSEAVEFEASLTEAFKGLATQLGQVRKRFAA